MKTGLYDSLVTDNNWSGSTDLWNSWGNDTAGMDAIIANPNAYANTDFSNARAGSLGTGGNAGLMSNINMGDTGTWNGAGSVMSGIGALGSMYLGFKGLGLMEDQVDTYKDKWNTTKTELAHLRGVRTKLNQNYMA